jgi:hypothetical protein
MMQRRLQRQHDSDPTSGRQIKPLRQRKRPKPDTCTERRGVCAIKRGQPQLGAGRDSRVRACALFQFCQRHEFLDDLLPVSPARNRAACSCAQRARSALYSVMVETLNELRQSDFAVDEAPSMRFLIVADCEPFEFDRRDRGPDSFFAALTVLAFDHPDHDFHQCVTKLTTRHASVNIVPTYHLMSPAIIVAILRVRLASSAARSAFDAATLSVGTSGPRRR